MTRRYGSFRSSFASIAVCAGWLVLSSALAAQASTVLSEQKISETAGGFGGVLDPSDVFGRSVASLGDLDGDGIVDLAVGAPLDGDGAPAQGAVWILFMNADGTVDSEQKISETAGGFGGILASGDAFGWSIASPGDLDGDGNEDLVAGALLDDNGQGSIWVLFLNADGTVDSELRVSEAAGGFGGALDLGDQFGESLASLGDLDGNGIGDLAVGAGNDDDGGGNQGAVWILFMNADGTVASEQKISETTGGFAGVLDGTDHFGSAIAALGDLDGDGVDDLAVSASGDDDGGLNQGAVWILFMNADGTVDSEQKISETAGGFGGVLDPNDLFGHSVAALGDVDGDGIGDLAVGARLDDDGGSEQGGVWILLLNADGTVDSEQKISETAGGFGGVLDPGDSFGWSAAALGDLDADGNGDLAVGAPEDDDGGTSQGAVWILFLGPDTTPPVITCPSDVTAECTSSGGAAVTFDVSAVDDVDPAPSVVAIPPSGSTFPLGTTTVSCTATDSAGNSSMCSFDVTVEDSTPPVVSCPSDITTECTGPSGAVVSFSPSASDGCDPAPSIVALPPSGSTFPLGTTTVTVTATDDAGNSALCSFDVTVEDSSPPVVTCPSDITTECTGPSGAVVSFSPSASDGCDAAPSLVALPPSGSAFPLGTTTVTVTATDDAGNSSMCTFDVTVEDSSPPIVTCPSDVTTECTGPSGAVVSFSPSASDGCDAAPSIVALPPSGSAFPVGTTTVTVTATDDGGNSSQCTFDVTVEDTTAPVLTCPEDVLVSCADPKGQAVSFSVSAEDGCDASPDVDVAPPSGSVFPLGTTTVTCTAMDAAGNSSMCTFDVTLEADTTTPVLTCPDLFVECSGGEGTVVTYSPAAGDDCDPSPAVVCVPPSGSTFPMGTTSVSCTATDDAGNSSMCSFDVTVQDETPPVVTCPADMTVFANTSATFSASALDGCDGPVSAACSPPSGSIFPPGPTTVTCMATDSAGNTGFCSFTVTGEVVATVPALSLLWLALLSVAALGSGLVLLRRRA